MAMFSIALQSNLYPAGTGQAMCAAINANPIGTDWSKHPFEEQMMEGSDSVRISRGTGASGGVQVNYGVPIDNFGYEERELEAHKITPFCKIYEHNNACAATTTGRALMNLRWPHDKVDLEPGEIRQLKALFSHMVLTHGRFLGDSLVGRWFQKRQSRWQVRSLLYGVLCACVHSCVVNVLQ